MAIHHNEADIDLSGLGEVEEVSDRQIDALFNTDVRPGRLKRRAE